ncbi:MAG: HpcH/HpaI aldolase family protein [Rhizomicrobium sp.]
MSHVLRNPAKDRLAVGELVLCLSIRQMRSVESAMIAQACGFDVIIIDREHTPISAELTSGICVAALGLGLTPMVRVATPSLPDIGNALDTGALGIIAPQVNSAADAEAVVRYAKYPPMGRRSVAALGPAMRYQPPALPESLRAQNDATLICVLLETAEAIANARDIARVPGIDVLMIGSVDLSTEYGVPGQFADAKMQRAYEMVASACGAEKKQFAVAGGSREQQAKFVAMGARMIMGGMDVNYFMTAAKQETAALRALFPGTKV